MRERDLKTTDTDGVSLVTAIRQFSDTNAWAEVDRLLGIIPGVETSTGWTDLDWARYDFKVILGLKVVALRTWDKIDARHRWAKLSIAFKGVLPLRHVFNRASLSLPATLNLSTSIVAALSYRLTSGGF